MKHLENFHDMFANNALCYKGAIALWPFWSWNMYNPYIFPSDWWMPQMQCPPCPSVIRHLYLEYHEFIKGHKQKCLFIYIFHMFKKNTLHPIPIVSKNITNKIVNGLKYSLGSAYTIRIAHMGVEEIFGSYKWKANLAPRSKGDSHKHNRVNFSHPHVNHTS
jgi:hypothetical protein